MYIAFVYLLHPWLGVLTIGGALILTMLTLLTEALMRKRSIAAQKAAVARATLIDAHTRNADIIVAAMGVPHFLKANMVRDGAVVVDVGINRVDDAAAAKGYRIVGDVDFDAVAPKCSLITPVPVK